MATGKTFYWLGLFEVVTAIEVPQPQADSYDEPLPMNQAVIQRWNRSGTVNISPGQATEDVVKEIVTLVKDSGDVPPDALLTNLVLLPNVLVPR